MRRRIGTTKAVRPASIRRPAKSVVHERAPARRFAGRVGRVYWLCFLLVHDDAPADRTEAEKRQEDAERQKQQGCTIPQRTRLSDAHIAHDLGEKYEWRQNGSKQTDQRDHHWSAPQEKPYRFERRTHVERSWATEIATSCSALARQSFLAYFALNSSFARA